VIVRLGLNVALHLAAGVAFGACAVLAGAYLVEKRRRECDVTPVATGGGAGTAAMPAPGAPGD
jgi:hypothetical protein